MTTANNIGESLNNQLTDVSATNAHTSLMGSDAKPREGGIDEASQQMTQMMSLSGQGPGHKDSLATNDTSKQVFGQKQMMTPKMPSKTGPGRGDGSMLAGELASIKEDQGAT